ncbi:MAG: HAMP domain-containing protein [Deltaproteobacteria bacterium]|nr:HAMP domain-containing protein [Deltaproteobacteria bacterium]
MAEGGSHGSGGARGAASPASPPTRPSVPPRFRSDWPAPRAGGLGLRAQIVVSLALLMAVILGMLALGTHALVPLAFRRAVGPARDAMAHALARDLARSHADPSAARAAVRTALEAPAIDGAAVWDRGRGTVAAGVPPAAGAFPGAVGPSFTGPRVDETEGGTVVREPSPDRAGCGAVRVAAVEPTGALGSVEALLLAYLGLSALAVVVFGYILMTRLVVRPIERLTAAARRLERGVPADRVTPTGGRELVDLASAFNAMADEVTAHRVRLEEQVASLEQLNRDVSRAQEQVIRSAKLASVGQLAAGIAHEIGNPLTVMLGFFDVLEGMGEVPTDAREHLRTMRQEAERVNRIIRDLLDYARANPEPVDAVSVGEVIDGTVALLAPQKPFRVIEIQVTVPSDLPPVRANRDRLRQVLVNVLLNAADAIGQSAGTVSLRAERASLPRGGEAVRVLVTDTGPGIAAELLDAIFEPFVTTKQAGAGTGLGLAVSHAIVDGLGGTIRAWNPPNGGACFEVLLPAA